MTSYGLRTLAELGPRITLAPERYREDRDTVKGVPLSDLVVEVRERLVLHRGDRAIVLDTTHVKDGLLDLSAARARALPLSAKWRVPPGALLVSRLRPYLRQIGFASRPLFSSSGELAHGGPLGCSTEFSVLVPSADGESLAYLLPFLLSAPAQAFLAAGQEGDTTRACRARRCCHYVCRTAGFAVVGRRATPSKKPPRRCTQRAQGTGDPLG